MRVLRADGAAARHGTEGTLLGEGRTGEVVPLGAGRLAWAGLAADPFTADGIALAGFLAGLAAGQYDLGVFRSAPGNIFAGRDVTAVALQVPDADLEAPASRCGRGSACSAMPRNSRSAG